MPSEGPVLASVAAVAAATVYRVPPGTPVSPCEAPCSASTGGVAARAVGARRTWTTDCTTPSLFAGSSFSIRRRPDHRPNLAASHTDLNANANPDPHANASPDPHALLIQVAHAYAMPLPSRLVRASARALIRCSRAAFLLPTVSASRRLLRWLCPQAL